MTVPMQCGSLKKGACVPVLCVMGLLGWVANHSHAGLPMGHPKEAGRGAGHGPLPLHPPQARVHQGPAVQDRGLQHLQDRQARARQGQHRGDRHLHRQEARGDVPRPGGRTVGGLGNLPPPPDRWERVVGDDPPHSGSLTPIPAEPGGRRRPTHTPQPGPTVGGLPPPPAGRTLPPPLFFGGGGASPPLLPTSYQGVGHLEGPSAHHEHPVGDKNTPQRGKTKPQSAAGGKKGKRANPRAEMPFGMLRAGVLMVRAKDMAEAEARDGWQEEGQSGAPWGITGEGVRPTRG